jgi:oligoribonuclease NrnB/cAMP/cGMP phosphodiesterase (DHH superfamily)
MSIPLEVLNNVRTILVHKNCPDGIASAMILKHTLNRPVVFLQYGTDEYTHLEATPGMLFCDTTPPHYRVQEFVDAGAIVLDHHKGAQDIVAKFGERGVFADEKEEPGVCGAVLAYREVWLKMRGPDSFVEHFAAVAGVRDTWQTKDPRWNESCAQSSWLFFFGEEACLESPIFGDETTWNFRVGIGDLLWSEHMRKIAKTVGGALRVSLSGLRIVIHQGVTHTSDAAEMLGEESKVDILAGFSYFADGATERDEWSDEFGDNLKMVVSTRTRTDFDVSKLAKFYGGGGHTKAAGFTVKIGMENMNPYMHILSLISNYLGSMGVQHGS